MTHRPLSFAKKHSRKLFCSLFVLSTLAFSASVEAKIPPRAFKGITKHFKAGKEYLSPTLGAALIETGGAENMVTFGNFSAAYREDRSRDYANDESNDPHWNIAKILFPSPGGTFGTNTLADTNLGRFVTSLKTVALLLTYAHDLRENKTPDIDAAIEDILKTLELEKNKVKDFKKKTLRPLLNSIKAAIEKEKALAEKKEKGLYPTHTPEQVIEAFFCYKFDTYDHIKELIKALPDEIVDHTVPFPAKEEELLEKEDIQQIANLPSNIKLGIDEAFALGIADTFSSSIPYRPGVSPLSNGPTQYYDRKSDTFTNPHKRLADCAEISVRHMLNLALYDPVLREFNLTPLIERQKKMKKDSSQYALLQHLIEFYEKQPVDRANAGDLDTRSSFNRVIGDLNAVPGGPQVIYVQSGSNELETGVMNLIAALQKILSADLEIRPEVTAPLETQKAWAEKSLQALFAIFNPQHKYQIKMESAKWDVGRNDLYGVFDIVAEDDKLDTPLFSYSYETTPNHSEISNLKDLLTSDEDNLDVNEVLKIHSTVLQPSTTDESLWLLLPNMSEQKVTEPLYRLFPGALADNDSKINFIDTLEKLSPETLNPEVQQALPLMLAHVLKSLSWEDGAVVEKFTRSLASIFAKPSLPSELKKVFYQNTFALSSTSHSEAWKNLVTHHLPQFTNLKSLLLKKFKERSLTISANNAKLEVLSISKSSLTKLDGLENLSALKTFKARSSKLSELVFTATHAKLETLNISFTPLTKVEGLENLSALKTFEAESSNLSELAFSEAHSNLETLNISSSSLKKVDGLENLSALKTFKARSSKLSELAFTTAHAKLEEIYIFGSCLTKVDGLEYLSALKIFYAGGPNISELAFSAAHAKLETLNIFSSSLKKLQGLENLSALKTFDAGESKLSELTFTAVHTKLEELDISDTSLTKVEGLEHLSALKIFYAGGPNISELAFSAAHAKLETLNIGGTSVKKLQGLEHLLKLKQIDACDMQNMPILYMPKKLHERFENGLLTINHPNIQWVNDEELR